MATLSPVFVNRSEENVSTNSRSSAEKVLQSSLPARFAEKVTAKGQQLSLPAGSAEEVKGKVTCPQDC